MTDDSSRGEPAGFGGAPTHSARSRPGGRTIALAVLAAGALAVGAVGIAAADASNGSASPSAAGVGARARHHGFGGGGGPGDVMGRGALRGEFVVPKSGGGYQTIATQRGAVTKVSSSSIMVKSDDGTSRTYRVTPDTLVNAARDGISTVKEKDAVRVAAIRNGDTLTAVRIVDASRLDASRQRFGFPRPDGDRSSPSGGSSGTQSSS